VVVDYSLAVACHIFNFEECIFSLAMIIRQPQKLRFVLIQVGADRPKNLNLIDEFLRPRNLAPLAFAYSVELFNVLGVIVKRNRRRRRRLLIAALDYVPLPL
jgi:hypothetical protein